MRKTPTSEYPLVSVVVPCFNQSLFLGEAIESVLEQSYPEIEVIVVDDGSTDDTALVTAEYPQVRYLKQSNQGLAAARNAGLRISRGELLVFLDADDRLLPGALQAGVGRLSDCPDCAFVYGKFQYINEDGSFLNQENQEPASEDIYAALLQGNFIGMHATVMYRREALLDEGGFNPALHTCEDYDLYLRLARKHIIAGHDRLVAAYRQHPQNMSNNAGMMLKTALQVLRSQWPQVKAEPGYQSAYQAGIRFWQAYYSRRLYLDVVDSWSRDERRRVVAIGKTWARYAPREFARYCLWLVKVGITRGGKAMLPLPIYRWLARRRGTGYQPAAGEVDFGDLRRLAPISREFGLDRGLPIDRYYIEKFLQAQADSIRGRVLEIGDDSYTRRFGGDRVAFYDVLHIKPGNPKATIVGDLAHADHIPSEAFDCIVLTQTLHLIYDVRSAIQTLHRILKPGGVLLATFPGISQISIDEWAESWYWAFTERVARRLFEERFPPKNITVEAYGNVLASTAFLNGLAAEELETAELDHRDPNYPMLITLRAEKPGSTSRG